VRYIHNIEYFAAGGKKHKEATFLNTVLDVCSNRGSKHEMGAHILKGGPGTTPPTLATALCQVQSYSTPVNYPKIMGVGRGQGGLAPGF